MAMTADEIIQRARRGGYSPGLADDNTMADEVVALRLVKSDLNDMIQEMKAEAVEQAARIASLKGEIGRWATAYNELHERITTAQLALRRARFNPMETT